MKTRILLLLCLPLLLLSCGDDNNYYDSSSIDRKAYQMQTIGSVFDVIARQPALQATLLSSAMALAGYDSIADLAPLTDKAVEQRGLARGEGIGLCLDAMARQPEMMETFEKLCLKFYGQQGDGIITEEINVYSRMAALSSLNTVVARQPERASSLRAFANKVLGTNLSTDSLKVE